MHKILIGVLLLSAVVANAQVLIDDPGKGSKGTDELKELPSGFGIGLGIGTNQGVLLEVLYRHERNMFRLGWCYEAFAGQALLPHFDESANAGSYRSNYDFFSIGTLGYDYWFAKRFAVGIQASAGTRCTFFNFNDPDVFTGRYFVVDESKFIAGAGFKVHYLPKAPVMISVGYETIMGANFTLSFTPFARRVH